MRWHILAVSALVLSPPLLAQPAAPGREAEFIPSNTFAFVSVRVSDLRDVAALKPVREVIVKMEKSEGGLDRLFGLPLDSMARLTLLWPAGLDKEPRPFVLVTTREPFNEVRLIKALEAYPASMAPGLRVERGWDGGGGAHVPVPIPTPPAKAADHPIPTVPALPKNPPPLTPKPAASPPKLALPGTDGAQVKGPPADPKFDRPITEPEVKVDIAPDESPELYILPARPFSALLRLDNRTLLYCPPSNIGHLQLIGQLLYRGADGPLADAIAAVGKHTLVAGLRMGPVEAMIFGEREAPREFLPFRSLFRARTATLTMDVDARATVNARLTFADATAARRAEPVLKTLIQTAVDSLAEQRKTAARHDPEFAKILDPLLELAAGALDRAEVKAEGTVVSARIETDIGPAVARTLAALPDLTEIASSRQRSLNNLKQIGLAIHNYHDTMNQMPTNVVDAAGKPILSWRVQILPYIEQDNLYRQLDLTKPWDDPRNAKLLEKMPDVFRVYDRTGHEKGLTYFQMPSSPQRVLGGDPFLVPGQKMSFAQIPDGTSNTLMVVEAAEGVPWAKPVDVPYHPMQLPKLGREDRKWFLALFGDGSVRTLRRDAVHGEKLKALITVNGGEVIDIDRD